MDRIICTMIKQTAMNQTKCLSTATNLCKKKDHIYGNEFGHSINNEFRKDKWVRKTYRRPKGEDWRVKKGFGKVPPLEGSLQRVFT